MPEIFCRHLPDVLGGDLFDLGFQFFEMIEAKAIKFIERRHVTKGIVALVGDPLLTDQLFLGPRQLIVR